MSNHFEHVDVSQFTVEDFTQQLIAELASLVGVDALTEFSNHLKKERPDLFFPFLVRVQEFYWSQQENKVQD